MTLEATRSDINRTNLSGTVWEKLDARVASASIGTEQFDFAAWRKQNGESALPLLTVDAENRVTVATANAQLDPKPGVTLVALIRTPDSE